MFSVCAVAYVRSEPSAASSRRTASSLRPVRVLVASGVKRIRIRADGALSVVGDKGLSFITDDASDWLVVSPGASSGIRVGEEPWPVPKVRAAASSNVTSMSVDRDGWSPGIRYAGELHLVVRDNGRLDVVNHVDVETYVGCVVAGEVWPTFHTEAYRAQAIVSRTFVLYQMKQRQGASFDVTATQRSQVYRGLRTDQPGRRAVEAAAYTRGVVLAWRDNGTNRLFCTYYSAACGGMSQSAGIFGPANDIPPLAGNVPCDYCKIAPGETYRWGPVRLTKQEVRGRLVAVYPDLAVLGRVQSLHVTDRTPSGRPVGLRIVGSDGASHDMLAERFRLAMGGRLLRSTDFTIRETSLALNFEKGRGFGHGLGLCQWGMQGQALLGKQAGEILRYYYPGARLARAY